MIFGECEFWNYLGIPVRLIGVYGIWGFYNFIVRKDFVLNGHKWLVTACNYTFFIYLFHVPMLNIVRKLIVIVLGKTSFGYMASYLASPWIFAFMAILVGIWMRRNMREIYLVCTGGR